MHEFNLSSPFTNCGGKIHPLIVWCPSLHFGRNLEGLSSCFVFFTSVPHYSYMSSVCPAPHGRMPVFESGASVSHVRPCLRWWGFRRFQWGVCPLRCTMEHLFRALPSGTRSHSLLGILWCFFVSPRCLEGSPPLSLKSRRVVVAGGPPHCAALIRCRFSRV